MTAFSPSASVRETAAAATVSRPPRVLTIDDDPNVCQSLRRQFDRFEVELLQACCGAHGIFLAKTRRPDVIVTDLRMPLGEGQFLVAWLKQAPETRDIPVIVLTGMHDLELEEHVRSLGVEHYFSKPVAFETLCSALRQFAPLRRRAPL
jgi:response regulator RpfG family c-di-GMP phosphodiesterase